MRVVANNIANAATTGFRQEGVIFTEFVRRSGTGSSLSIADAGARQTSVRQGTLDKTAGAFDLAIQGEGYFLLDTPDGERLTRAGSFGPDANGNLVNADGHRLLDVGGAPLFVPPDINTPQFSSDGTLSDGGRALGQVGIFQPAVPGALTRKDGVMFQSDGGVEPVEGATLVQGFL